MHAWIGIPDQKKQRPPNARASNQVHQGTGEKFSRFVILGCSVNGQIASAMVMSFRAHGDLLAALDKRMRWMHGWEINGDDGRTRPLEPRFLLKRSFEAVIGKSLRFCGRCALIWTQKKSETKFKLF
jgi:hypothetical protein